MRVAHSIPCAEPTYWRISECSLHITFTPRGWKHGCAFQLPHAARSRFTSPSRRNRGNHGTRKKLGARSGRRSRPDPGKRRVLLNGGEPAAPPGHRRARHRAVHPPSRSGQGRIPPHDVRTVRRGAALGGYPAASPRPLRRPGRRRPGPHPPGAPGTQGDPAEPGHSRAQPSAGRPQRRPAVRQPGPAAAAGPGRRARGRGQLRRQRVLRRGPRRRLPPARRRPGQAGAASRRRPADPRRLRGHLPVRRAARLRRHRPGRLPADGPGAGGRQPLLRLAAGPRAGRAAPGSRAGQLPGRGRAPAAAVSPPAPANAPP